MNNQVYCEKCNRDYWVTPAGDCPGCGRLITFLPGFHVHPILVDPRIVRAVERFRKEHPEYKTIAGAKDRGYLASIEFINMLDDEGYPVGSRDIPIPGHTARIDQLSVGGVSHTAVHIGPVWIDWTFRQFDHTVRFPKVSVDQ